MPRRASAEATGLTLRRSLFAMIEGLRHEWRASIRLAKRSFFLRYRNSRFGLLWEFLDPLMLAAIFILLHEYRGIRVQPTGLPYPLFVITGLMLWQSFTDGLNGGERAISSQKALLSAVKVAPELIVLSNVYLVLFSTAIRLGIGLCAIALLVGIDLAGLAAFVVLGLCLTLFGCGLGFFLSPFTTVLGDVRFGVRIFTRLGMFLSSVIFPLPTGYAVMEVLRALNPAAVLIENARGLGAAGAAVDSLPVLAIYIVLSLVTFLFGWYVVHVTLPIVGDQ